MNKKPRYANLVADQVVPVETVGHLKGYGPGQAHLRTVANTKVGEAEVSTVFLGINHGMGGPCDLWFETLVFGGPCDGDQLRYETLSDAKAGHEEMVTLVRQKMQT